MIDVVSRTLASPLAAVISALAEQPAACLHVPDDKHVILTVSRISLYKGHGLVFRALAALPEQARDA